MLTEYNKKNLEEWLEKPLALGIFFILIGLPLLQKTSHYQTIYYILTILPLILFLAVRPNKIISKISNITKIFIYFALWSSVTIFWSDTQEPLATPITRSIYILSLFISFSIITRRNEKTILNIFIASGLIVAALSTYELYNFVISYQPGSRFIGTGALSNPLLSSHVFGLFSVLFFAITITAENNKTKFIYLLLALIFLIAVTSTGSRTPLLALTTTAIWIAFILNNKKSFIIIFSSAMLLIIIYAIYPEAIISRGFSYRPELWDITIDKIILKPITGYGFDSNSGFYISSLDTTFREPHNIHLSILYFTGIIGFSLWCAMHAYALWVCWKNKLDPLFIIGSALLIYGITAGMTEGGGLLPRPKEHWFITWIPLAFISALLTNKTINAKTKEHISHNI